MPLLGKVKELAQNSLIEAKLIKGEESPEKIKKYVERLLKKASKLDKTELCRMSNHEIFFTFLILTNDNTLSFDETFMYCEEVKKQVNSWTFDKVSNQLLELQNGTNNDGSLINFQHSKTFTELGLTPVFVSYNMKLVYMCMYDFLKLKKDILEPQEYIKKLPLHQRYNVMNKIYKQSRFYNFVDVAKQCLERDVNDYNYRQELVQKRIKATNEVIKSLNEGTLEETYEFPSEWHQYLDPNLLETIYEIVLMNLNKQKKEIETEETELLQKKESSTLTSYLYNNGFNPYSLEDRLEILETIPNIIAKIEFFKSLNIPINNILTKYYQNLITINDEQIKKFEFLIGNKILFKETLKNNLMMVDSSYQKIITNYEIIKSITDFENMFYKDTILFKDTKELKNIILILKEYKLTKNNYIFLLCNFEYINIYDLIIENDIPESLFISICETSDPIKTIKRIIVYKSIGEEYETINHFLKKEVTNESKFICDDNTLEEFVPDIASMYGLNILSGSSISSIVEHPLVKKLDSEYKVENVYLFGNTIISRQRFLRNFEQANGDCKLLVASLISNTILDESSYYEIINELNKKQLKK